MKIVALREFRANGRTIARGEELDADEIPGNTLRLLVDQRRAAYIKNTEDAATVVERDGLADAVQSLTDKVTALEDRADASEIDAAERDTASQTLVQQVERIEVRLLVHDEASAKFHALFDQVTALEAKFASLSAAAVPAAENAPKGGAVPTSTDETSAPKRGKVS